MERLRNDEEQKSVGPPLPFWKTTWFEVVILVVVIAIVLLAAAIYVARHAEPILRRRVVETLSKRFNSPVELDELHISVARGLEVNGRGLRILYLAGPTQPSHGEQPAPMLSVDRFSFHTSFRDLVHRRARIAIVNVDGMEIHIPPHRDDKGNLQDDTSAVPQAQPPPKQPMAALLVHRIRCRNAKLFIETNKPGKDPLEFEIQNLVLTDVGGAEPLLYEADVINPKPKGNVHAAGHFGPWQTADPRSTPIDGDYSFDHADFNTIKGLGGTLSSTGHYAGELGHITIDGTTSTPNFSLDISNHPVSLETKFHAFVDGTTGDTTLAPVEAVLGRSKFTCAGAIVRVKGKGHDIALTVDMPSGRIEDLLQLGMKTQPPIMSGGVSMKAKIHIPPGPVRVAAKLETSGNLTISAVHFSNAKLQDRVDSLSMRAQGRPDEVKVAGVDHRAEVASRMAVNFALAQELMTVNTLHYEIPGAKVDLRGVYTLNGNLFEFKGHVRTDATASQMTTGWKSLLLKAVDPLLKKNGAGVELPISITGSKGDFNVGLAMHDADKTPEQMSNDIKVHQQMHPAKPH